MAEKKRPWQEPIIKSIDQCQPIFGVCKTGSTEDPNDPTYTCQTGSGAQTEGSCTTGNGAKKTCLAGNGVK